ncbi:MAG: shikimate dehydrogenase [Clostridia bacterium]
MKLGLIGKSLGHSASRTIHRHFFEITGRQGSYELFEIENEKRLAHHLMMFEKAGFAGINVTIPYKQAVMPLLDNVGEEAQKIGAVNTIRYGDGIRTGHNTDYFGFIKTLGKEGMEAKGKKWLVLGYGGAARSVIAALKDLGGEVVCASTRARGEGFIGYDRLSEVSDAEGVVNTTPVGMFPDIHRSVVGEEVFTNCRYAVDLVYNPLETLFMQTAKACGARTVNGLYMLVAQAVKAQEIWNSQAMEDSLIDAIYLRMQEKP